jgi:hypothetical protein
MKPCPECGSTDYDLIAEERVPTNITYSVSLDQNGEPEYEQQNVGFVDDRLKYICGDCDCEFEISNEGDIRALFTDDKHKENR